MVNLENAGSPRFSLNPLVCQLSHSHSGLPGVFNKKLKVNHTTNPNKKGPSIGPFFVFLFLVEFDSRVVIFIPLIPKWCFLGITYQTTGIHIAFKEFFKICIV